MFISGPYCSWATISKMQLPAQLIKSCVHCWHKIWILFNLYYEQWKVWCTDSSGSAVIDLFKSVETREEKFSAYAKCTFQVILRMRTIRSGLLFSIHSTVSSDSICGQWRSWSACAPTQAHLGLRCPHKPEDKFSLCMRTGKNTYHENIPI